MREEIFAQPVFRLDQDVWNYVLGGRSDGAQYAAQQATWLHREGRSDTAVDDVQHRTVGMAVDMLTFKPLTQSLEDAGILKERERSGCQSQPELEYLKTVNGSGPAGSTLIV